ncbi:MAG: Crp/Fnr family transcriptional regulator [Clostridia bacterium]|nr:Crp/Fnr family transcriptional regulator [Clostridia bacterium]
MDRKILELLRDNPLFRGADEELLFSVLKDGTKVRHFSADEVIFTHENSEKYLVLVLSGTARVFSQDVERSVLLRTLGKGDAFGVAELFGGSDISVSRVEAKNSCKVLFIPEGKMGQLLEGDKRIMYNYLDFLCCRIRFLNKRIACFTAGTAERRLAFYLDSLACDCEKSEETAKVTPEVSMGALALMLDIGRASLYRAIDTLTADGFIEKDGKSFLLRDREKMLKNYNK